MDYSNLYIYLFSTLPPPEKLTIDNGLFQPIILYPFHPLKTIENRQWTIPANQRAQMWSHDQDWPISMLELLQWPEWPKQWSVHKKVKYAFKYMMTAKKWNFVNRKTNKNAYNSIWYQRWVCTPPCLAEIAKMERYYYIDFHYMGIMEGSNLCNIHIYYLSKQLNQRKLKKYQFCVLSYCTTILPTDKKSNLQRQLKHTEPITKWS